MKYPGAKAPGNLDPLGLEILEKLRGNPAASALVLGGGFALQHYHEFRPSHDIDAWWADAPNEDAKRAIRDAVTRTANDNGFAFKERSWGETLSYEIVKHDGRDETVFSFQVAPRDIQIDAPVKSAWSPLLLETFRDNVASKMNALVDRGAPRDFIDIDELVRNNLVSVRECWELWQLKNPAADLTDAKDKLLLKMSQIEARTSLDALEPQARNRAIERRAFFKGAFLKDEDDRDLGR